MAISILHDYEPDTEVCEQRVRTLVGLPPPERLPGPLPGDSYAAKYPPKIDWPLIVEIVAEDGNG